MSRIAIDIDDTVSNTTEYLLKYAIDFDKEHVNGEGVVDSTKNLPRCFNWTDQDEELFVEIAYDKYVDDFSPIPGAVDVINKLKKDGNEIVFVTSRNSIHMRKPYERSFDWLSKHGIMFDKLIDSVKHKGPVLEEEKIDIFIDDSIGQTTFVADNYDIDVILFNRTKIVHKGIKVVDSWNDIYEYIDRGGKNEFVR